MVSYDPRIESWIPDWRDLRARLLESDTKGAPGERDIAGWTRQVFRQFMPPKESREIVAYLSSKFADELRGKGIGEDCGEYLIDLVWAVESAPNWESFHGLVLAMELEWGGTEERFWEDFCKLPDIRADRRLFAGVLVPELYEQLSDDGSDFVQSIHRFLSNHRHFRTSDEVMISVWCKHRDDEDLVTRVCVGNGTSYLLDE